MGEISVFEFLKKNSDKEFDAKELEQYLKITPRAIRAQLFRIGKDTAIKKREAKKGATNVKTMVYSYHEQVEGIEEIIHEFVLLKKSNSLMFFNTDQLLNLMIIKELRRVLKNGKRE